MGRGKCIRRAGDMVRAEEVGGPPLRRFRRGESSPDASRLKVVATGSSEATSILVVDDEPDVRFLLRMIFQGAGHSVVEARNGRAALDCIAEATPSAVVTDLMMPVMDGRELIEQLRADPQTATVPIVLISASPMDAAGADAVLKKPFRSEDLLALIEELLEGGVP